MACHASQSRRLQNVAKRLAHVKPWVNPDDPAALASEAEDLARREAAAAAASQQLLNVRAVIPLLSLDPTYPELHSNRQ